MNAFSTLPRTYLDTARFLLKKAKYQMSVTRTSSPKGHLNIWRDLERDGIAILPDFIETKTVLSMLEVTRSVGGFQESPEGDGARFRLGADKIAALSPFFHNEALKNIAQHYMGDDAIPLRQSIELRTAKGAVMAFDRMFHMDTWKHRLKFFFYLHDVDEEGAPLHYLKGSHRGTWRIPMEGLLHDHYSTGNSGYAVDETTAYLGCYWPYEVDYLKRRHRFEEISCVGRAGTLVVFDARGLHRATLLNKDERRILISYWIRKNNHI